MSVPTDGSEPVQLPSTTRPKTVQEEAKEKAKVVEYAADLLAALRDAYPKHADHMTGHNGSDDWRKTPGSGAILSGRDRSTQAVAQRNKEKLAALSGEVGEDGFPTPKKKVSVFKWAKLARIG
jgi:hypothetical protein